MLKVVVFTLVFLPILAKAQRMNQPRIGSKSTDGHYSLTFNFGIEQYEDNKKSDFRLQNWALDCSYPDKNSGRPDKTVCFLKRTVYDRLFTEDIGTTISEHLHSESDGNLQVRPVDWSHGKLDFTIEFTDGNTAEVMVRWKELDDTFYMNSFKAIGVARGRFSDSMSSIEYRIPEYTYTLEMPIRFNGLKSEEDKKRLEFENSLSLGDRKIWLANVNELFEPSASDEQELAKNIPGYAELKANKRAATAEENVLLRKALVGVVITNVRRLGLSPEGTTKALSYVEGIFPESK